MRLSKFYFDEVHRVGTKHQGAARFSSLSTSKAYTTLLKKDLLHLTIQTLNKTDTFLQLVDAFINTTALADETNVPLDTLHSVTDNPAIHATDEFALEQAQDIFCGMMTSLARLPYS